MHYDLTPRVGKTPVAFTDFGGRPHLVDGEWLAGEPWVFATYRVGGLDNLDELLHETGHAVHISAIHQRPAFLDWPDNDALTEGSATSPRSRSTSRAGRCTTSATRCRRRSVCAAATAASCSTSRGRCSRCACTAIRADPNAVWDDITSRYLHITPHPELSWWAMRGQLIDAPGYMANYAIGSIIIADIRARVRDVHGDFTTGDPTWYAFMSDHIYRFGLSRSSRR